MNSTSEIRHLKENNLNEEPTAGAVAIQIILAMDMCLPRPYPRISCKSDPATNSYSLILDPLTHSPTVANGRGVGIISLLPAAKVKVPDVRQAT